MFNYLFSSISLHTEMLYFVFILFFVFIWSTTPLVKKIQKWMRPQKEPKLREFSIYNTILVFLLGCTLVMACSDFIEAGAYFILNYYIVNKEIDYSLMEYANISKILFCIISVFCALFIKPLNIMQGVKYFDYYGVFVIILFGWTMLFTVDNLLLMLLMLEIATLASIILVSQDKGNPLSKDGALNYLFLSSISTILSVVGIGMIYFSTHVQGFYSLATLMWNEYEALQIMDFSKNFGDKVAQHNFCDIERIVKIDSYEFVENPPSNIVLFFVGLGVLFMLISFLIKLTSVPFYEWSIKAYDKAPISSAIIVSILPKVPLFVLLIRWIHACKPFLTMYPIIFYLIGIVSIVVSTYHAARETSLKRMFFYSSIGQTGYVIMLLPTIEIGPFASMFHYILGYTLITLQGWTCLVLLFLEEEIYRQDRIPDGALARFLSRAGTFLKKTTLIIFLLAASGLPPLAFFTMKVGIVSDTLFVVFSYNDFLPYLRLFANVLKGLKPEISETESFFFAIGVVAASVQSMFLYMRIIKLNFFEKTKIVEEVVAKETEDIDDEVEAREAKKYFNILYMKVLMFIVYVLGLFLSLLIIYSMFDPSPIHDMAQYMYELMKDFAKSGPRTPKG